MAAGEINLRFGILKWKLQEFKTSQELKASLVFTISYAYHEEFYRECGFFFLLKSVEEGQERDEEFRSDGLVAVLSCVENALKEIPEGTGQLAVQRLYGALQVEKTMQREIKHGLHPWSFVPTSFGVAVSSPHDLERPIPVKPAYAYTFHKFPPASDTATPEPGAGAN